MAPGASRFSWVSVVLAASAGTSAGAAPLSGTFHERLVEKREIVTFAVPAAQLPEGVPAGAKFLRVSTRVHVRAPLAAVKKALLDFASYPKLSSHVESASYSWGTLRIVGKLWQYRMESSILIEDDGTSGFRYRVHSGTSAGMTGEVTLEADGDRGTVLGLDTGVVIGKWTPNFLVEKGSRAVLDAALSRFRERVESSR